jgi:hypothetical protein
MPNAASRFGEIGFPDPPHSIQERITPKLRRGAQGQRRCHLRRCERPDAPEHVGYLDSHPAPHPLAGGSAGWVRSQRDGAQSGHVSSVLGLLKLKPAAEVRHNGQDFTPLLFGLRDPSWRTEIFGQYDLHNSGLAYMRMLRTNDWKLVRYYHTNGLDELCELKNDPGELTNLYRDPHHRDVRARLQ